MTYYSIKYLKKTDHYMPVLYSKYSKSDQLEK